MPTTSNYATSVFINCPFDPAYRALFEAIVFTVFDCGFSARCALESEDGGQVRLEKIFDIISECRLGISDLSKADLDSVTNLPRFNMPLELGIFLGARRYGSGRQREKRCLILDREKYRYRTFISDLAGQDIQEHGDELAEAIRVVRNWLRSQSRTFGIPGGRTIIARYQTFRNELPEMCQEARLSDDDLIFVDYVHLVSEWLRRTPWS
ncbi:MAG TPA: hypothetical protein VJ725_33085 [Thermoanaerobaculia bacterium]|nr:hypothetical protein [Thermoanaerobaculia bacterium]